MRAPLPIALVAAILTASPGVSAAEGVPDRIRYMVCTKAGGGFDAYGRLVAPFLEKHLGDTEVAVENVPGAGHIVCVNKLQGGPADGSMLATFTQGLIKAQILEQEGVAFDLTELSWIGKAASDPVVLVVGEQTGIDSVEDIRARAEPLLLSASGVGSLSHYDSLILAEALDLDLRVIKGFSGSEGELAILRGEIDGQLGAFSSFKSFLDNGYGKVVVRVGGDDIEALADVPQASDFVDEPDAQRLIELIRADAELYRLTAAPPGVPAQTLDTLRTAYAQALDDPELRGEAQARGRPIDPAGGAQVAQLVEAALDLPPDLVQRLRAILTCPGDGSC